MPIVSLSSNCRSNARADHYPAGERTTPSKVQTFLQYIYSFSTINTFVCYGASAYWYCVVYIWSQPAKSNLGMVDPGK